MEKNRIKNLEFFGEMMWPLEIEMQDSELKVGLFEVRYWFGGFWKIIMSSSTCGGLVVTCGSEQKNTTVVTIQDSTKTKTTSISPQI